MKTSATNLDVKRGVRAAAFAILAATAGLAAAAPETYTVDPVHASVIFKIKHIGATNFYGVFKDVSGTVTLDDENPAAGRIEIEIKADSVDTRNEKRDQHVKSPDFLNVAQFPTISFKSKEIRKLGDIYEVTGDLTLHGVTKPITVKFTRTGSGKNPRGAQVFGGEAQFSIKRSDFGMNFMPDVLSDDISIIVSLEGGKK